MSWYNLTSNGFRCEALPELTKFRWNAALVFGSPFYTIATSWLTMFWINGKFLQASQTAINALFLAAIQKDIFSKSLFWQLSDVDSYFCPKCVANLGRRHPPGEALRLQPHQQVVRSTPPGRILPGQLHRQVACWFLASCGPGITAPRGPLPIFFGIFLLLHHLLYRFGSILLTLPTPFLFLIRRFKVSPALMSKLLAPIISETIERFQFFRSKFVFSDI